MPEDFNPPTEGFRRASETMSEFNRAMENVRQALHDSHEIRIQREMLYGAGARTAIFLNGPLEGEQRVVRDDYVEVAVSTTDTDTNFHRIAALLYERVPASAEDLPPPDDGSRWYALTPESFENWKRMGAPEADAPATRPVPVPVLDNFERASTHWQPWVAYSEGAYR
jgi:hypothetical protein